MSVELDPAELGFKRPFTQEVSETLRLRNPNSDPVAFKVKTTAPKQYCVRPNSGRIEPGQAVEVSVLLQAMKEDPPMEAKCRDKFLVQSVAISADKDLNASNVWSSIDQSAKSSVQERKIRVIFLPADGSAAASTPSRRSLAADHEDEPPAYSSPSSTTMGTPAPMPVGAVSKPESKPSGSKNLGDAVDSTFNPATRSNMSTTAATIAPASVPGSVEDLKAQLAEARAQLSAMGKQTSDSASSGLRQRKAEASASDRGSSSTATTMAAQQTPGGVSVPVVAALCLLSFLLAYLLF